MTIDSVVAVLAEIAAGTPPTLTDVTGRRFVPEMVKLVPPPVPLVTTGEIVVNVGGDAKVKADALDTLPPGVVTTTETAVVDAAFNGVVTVTLVDVRAVMIPAVPPNVTDVVEPSAVPDKTIDWPPELDPRA